MVNYSKSLFVALVSLCCLQSVSLLQAQAIKTNLNQKVIYTDSLNLPRQTSINTMLTMMSELLQRPGATIYSNYDIQVNGMSVSDASEVALYQLGLQDVESIIITDSPTSSYLKNGQGGSINLVLRQKDDNNDGYWGSAGFDIAYPVDYSPQLHLGYRSQKFYISALALSDISHNTSTSENLTFVDDKTENSTLSDCTQISMLIGKRWRNLYVYTLVRQALKKNATNSKWYDNIREDYNYEMVPNMAAIGVKYLF